MSTRPTVLRRTGVSGAETVWLLEDSTPGRLAYVQREQAFARRPRHVAGVSAAA
ncbi:hypothetical protein [Streptomyces canus]|uniref:hypothetical protein n=1 Tax=Streptomyces canus TaxID=58343 RepID=UPI002E311523|nr:hypothetical protein [Streptomyces canus]